MDGVDQRHRALVAVGLQIHTLWRPRRAATARKEQTELQNCCLTTCLLLFTQCNTPQCVYSLWDLLPVAGLNVLSVGLGVQEAGQVGEACGDGVPLVKAEAAAQRIGAGRTRCALLSGHL